MTFTLELDEPEIDKSRFSGPFDQPIDMTDITRHPRYQPYTGPMPELPERLIGQPCRCLDPDCSIPYGVCHCGCGQLTTIYNKTDLPMGRVTGEHALCVMSHTFKLGTKPQERQFALPFLTPLRQKANAERKMVRPKSSKNKHNRPSDWRKVPEGTAIIDGKRVRISTTVPQDELLLMAQCLHEVYLRSCKTSRNQKDRRTEMSLAQARNALPRDSFGTDLSKAAWWNATRLLKDIGGYIQHGPGIKIMQDLDWDAVFASHGVDPDAVRARVQAQLDEIAAFEQSGSTSKPAPKPQPQVKVEGNAVSVIPSDVSDSDLAAALANAMWVRYESAVTEVGMLQEKLSAALQEIARLQSQVEAMEGTLGANTIARLMLQK